MTRPPTEAGYFSFFFVLGLNLLLLLCGPMLLKACRSLNQRCGKDLQRARRRFVGDADRQPKRSLRLPAQYRRFVRNFRCHGRRIAG